MRSRWRKRWDVQPARWRAAPLALLAAVVTTACLAAPSGAIADIDLPPNFHTDVVIGEDSYPGVGNLVFPTTLQFTPDGKVFVAERGGRILVFDGPDDPTPAVSADLSDNVHSVGDRGLLGMAFDPGYPTRPYLYVSYTYDAPPGQAAPFYNDACPPDPSCVVTGRIARLEIDPGSGLAEPDPENVAEELLVADWCQQFTSHSVSDVEFGADGALYVGGGDGASFETAGTGQFGICADPPLEGGALRSQDLRTPASPTDPTGYSGSILRIDPDTGAPLPDNPNIGSADVAARSVVAYGLRNQFRFEFLPGTSDLYLQDTGWYIFEEINRIPPGTQTVLNFGWPCFEGPDPQPDYDALDVPLCEQLYNAPTVTPPYFSHGNLDELYEGDSCPPDRGSASSGLAFYGGSQFPAQYSGNLFFADAARGCIWTMAPGPGGVPDPSTVQTFATSDVQYEFSPVDLVEGPDGDLFVPNFWGSQILRIHYTPGPDAELTADPTYGDLPLTVDFDASGSSGAGPLTFDFDLDGDGQFDDQSGPDPQAQNTFMQNQNETVAVRVTDYLGQTDVADVDLFPGDHPPAPQISSPPADLHWNVGDRIDFSGSATDPDEQLDPSELSWRVSVEHCPLACHSHPYVEVQGTGGFIYGPSHDAPSHLKFTLTATDSRGLSGSTSVEVYPNGEGSAGDAPANNPPKLRLRFASRPQGISLRWRGKWIATPFTRRVEAGSRHRLIAPKRVVEGGRKLVFARWSRGRQRARTVSPQRTRKYIAIYRRPIHR